MYRRRSLPLLLAAVSSACAGGSDAMVPVPSEPTVLLKDVMIPNLPSPYYAFAYDTAGRIQEASFASGLRVYRVRYDGDRIEEMAETVGSGDKLEYLYDNAGRVFMIEYLDADDSIYTRVALSYQGPELTGLERERRVDSGFIVDKTTTLSYYPDGNLLELRVHRPPIDGQEETTTVDRFQEYDDSINVDGFELIHDEFFDHLLLLPGVRFQKGNPRRQVHTGDGINFEVDYTYTYDDRDRPLAKDGDLTVSNGADAGRHFQTRSVFSYY